MTAQPLPGGMGNGGDVRRDGETVLRPAGPHGPAIRSLLRALADAGFAAPVPLGVADDVERFAWISGEVPVPPFPGWAMGDAALASVARLLRAYHETAAGLELPSGGSWSSEVADPQGGPIICHNDVCPENVVFRGGEAVALLDFDMAAPGRPLWDLAQMAKMWAPLRPPALAVGGMAGLDPMHRLGVLAQAYGLVPADHREFIDAIIAARRMGNAFLRRRLEAREPAFLQAWEPLGGERALEALLGWVVDRRGAMLAALTADS